MHQKFSPIGFKRSVFSHIWDAAAIIGLLLFWNSVHQTGLQLEALSIAVFVSSSWLICLLFFHLLQVYNVHTHSNILYILWRIAAGWALCVCTQISVIYMLKVNQSFPRLIIGPWALSVPFAMALLRVILHRYMQVRLQRGTGGQKTLIVGDSAHTQHVGEHFRQHPTFGIKIFGFISSIHRPESHASFTTQYQMTESNQIPIIGSVENLADIITQHSIHRVIIASDFKNGEQLIERVLNQLAQHPVTIQFAPDISNYLMVGLKSNSYAGQPIFDLAGCPLSATDVMMKWLVDKILSLIILTLIAPFLILIAIAIKLSSPGPILFTQERHGLYGRPIKILKFRTMKIPKNKQPQHKAGETTKEKFFQAQIKDPRISTLGTILRKTSLDELPQFFNVLGGSMSIVGPRPHALEHNQQFTATVAGLMKRHYIKPGITGLAQVNGARGITKCDADMEKRLRYDLDYIRNWSLWLDFKIIFLTIIRGFFNSQP